MVGKRRRFVTDSDDQAERAAVLDRSRLQSLSGVIGDPPLLFSEKTGFQ